MKKRIISIISVFLLSLSVVTPAFAATTSMTLYQSQHTNQSVPIWGNAGDTIYYEFYLEGSTWGHSADVGVFYEPIPYFGGTLLDHSIAYPRYVGGDIIVSAPYDGYYYIRVTCGGNEQTGCYGTGNLNTNY